MAEPTFVDDAGDPRLEAYVALNDAELRRRAEEAEGVLVAEGALVVRHAVRVGAPIRSVLLATPQLGPMRDVVDAVAAPVYVAPPEVVARAVGFDLHRGVLAAVARPDVVEVDTVLGRTTRVAVLEDVNDHENLGVIFRNAAALGVGGLLLSPGCADPCYRRSVRVSMGHVLSVPFARLAPWPGALHRVRDAGFVVAGLTPAGDVDVDDGALARRARVALLLGAEGPGLSPGALAACDVRVRIPMAGGVDSLNVGSAAAVAFHTLRDRAATPSAPRRPARA